MAYTKTTWNNLSDPPINADNLNKIEQGIYNNSLGIDIINPSGTATTTAEIEEGQISDVIGFKSLKLKGQTSQYTTTGKNLLPYPYVQTTRTAEGITYTDLGDGRIKINGTATANSAFKLLGEASSQVAIPGNYVYGGTNSNVIVRVMNRASDGTYTTLGNSTGSSASINKSTYSTGYVEISIANGTTVNDVIITPMITNTQDNNYEPYTGGKASPNPDYPQDVNNVSGDNVIGISNKNLFNKDVEKKSAYVGTSPSDIGNTVHYFNSGATYTYLNCAYVESGKTYTISWEQGVTPVSTNTRQGVIVDSNNIVLAVQNTWVNSSTHISFTPSVSGYIVLSTDTGATNIQIVKGSSVTSYIAHQGNEFEVNLEGTNLFNKYDYIEVNGTPNFGSSTGTFTGGGANSCIVIPCKPNTTYTAQKLIGGNADRFAFGCSATIPSSTDGTTTSTLNGARNDSAKSITITTGASAKYLIMHYYRNTETTYTKQQLLDSIQIELGNQATTYTPYNENPIELCKIGNYEDYIYKKDGKWWKHKEIGKIVLNGTTNSIASKSGNTANNTFISAVIPDILPPASNNAYIDLYCTHFRSGGTTNYIVTNNVLGIAVRMSKEFAIGVTLESPNNTVALMNTWLAENNVTVYYPRLTAIDEEITYTPLIRQLDELYNSGLYDVTNISQDNSGEVFILDIEACKNNINGIIEYIRR